ncbi:hypothetical protein IKP85_00910 [bacterium]|nr:hypothetical protein [bacterium]
MEKKLIKLNLARNCLRYIIRAYDIKEIFVPYYICPTVLTAIRKENCRIKFYHIDKTFYPQTDFSADDYILYPNYFGICAKQVIELSGKYKNLIADNAHNFYMPNFGLSSFCSIRKFFNVKDGAFLYISKTLGSDFETDDYDYEKFLRLTYEEMAANETRLNNEGIKFISPVTEKYFLEIDTEKEKQNRLDRFYKLHERFKEKNELKPELGEYDVPFVYPYLTHDETEAEKLEQEGYTILRYWNFLPENYPEYEFYKYLIPIPL